MEDRPALIENPASPAVQTVHGVLWVNIEQLEANPQQPRHQFDAQSLRTLAESIRQQGIIQPLLVRAHPLDVDRYQLIAGERRLQAMQWLQWSTVPVVVRALADQQLLEVALVENLQREPLTPIEEAKAYRHLLQLKGDTHQTLAERLGRERSTITNMLRLLHLPNLVQQWLETGVLTIGHARALLAVSHADQQIALGRWVIEKQLSVRETEKLVQRQKKRPYKARRAAQLAQGSQVDGSAAAQHGQAWLYQAMTERLEKHLATRVRIELEPTTDCGLLRIAFSNQQELQRMCDALLKHPHP